MITLPLTETTDGVLWSQHEYVACSRRNYGFAAHGAFGNLKRWFHYKLPDGCHSVLVFGATVERRVDHTFPVGLDWIERCRHAVAQPRPGPWCGPTGPEERP